MQTHIKRVWPVLLTGILTTAFAIVLRVYDPPIFSALRGAGFDTLQILWPRSNANPQPVRIVDIDEASLQSLGQWPWPRSQIAKLVDQLSGMEASAIVFDIMFAEPDRSSAGNDHLLAQAIEKRPVVTAFASSEGEDVSRPTLKSSFATTGNSAISAPPKLGKLTHNLPELDAAAAGIGSININLAIDQGVARQIPLLWTDGTRYYPSLVLEALRVAQNSETYIVNASTRVDNAIETIRVGEIEIPTSDAGIFQVHYRHNTADLYVSAADILNSSKREKLLPLIKGHIVLIGTSAVGLLDTRTSALGEAIPGVSVHAQALEQILSGEFLSRPDWVSGGEILIVTIFGLVTAWGVGMLRPLSNIIGLSALLSGIAGLAVYAFRTHGVLFDFTFPLMALALTYITTTAFKLLVTDQEGRQMRRMFSRYVAPTVLAEIERNPKAFTLGGEIREVTVMFVDIQNFTLLSEKMGAQELVRLVNTVLEACSVEILSEGGTIDKYIGDAVMAFWNAPLATPDHQYHAALAALKIRDAMARLNEEKEIKQILHTTDFDALSVRIGIASGPACVGNMGSTERFNYSVLGEAVNTAARAENACKHVGHDIVLVGPLQGSSQYLATLDAGNISMKGKSSKTHVFAVFGNEETRASHQFIEFEKAYRGIVTALKSKKRKFLPQPLHQIMLEFVDQYQASTSMIEKLSDRRDDFLP